MLPLMPGPSPRAFGTLAVLLTLAAGGAILAAAALFGFAALELLALLQSYPRT